MDKRILETVKMVALGASGTGKTSYLAEIFHQFFWNQYRVCDRETNPDDELIITISSNFEGTGRTSDVITEGNNDVHGFINNIEDYKALLMSVPSKTDEYIWRLI